jgi:adenosylhomocysteine nucleosidase
VAAALIEFFSVLSLFSLSFVAAPQARVGLGQAAPQSAAAGPAPIVVQGAMAIETERLAARLDNLSIDRVGGWTFWRGTVDGYPVIVSKTLKGMSNAAAATVIAIERYRPLAIINQGTAGGHDPGLRLFDVVLGTTSVNLGAFRSPYRAAGAGSNPLEWIPLNLTRADGSAANDPNARHLASFTADPQLLEAARRARASYARGRVVEGVIGSSDGWNDEIDLINRFRSKYGTLVEEMETASSAQIAGLFDVPFLGIRIVSDNVTNGTGWDPKTGEACEDFVYDVVRAYIAAAVRR